MVITPRCSSLGQDRIVTPKPHHPTLHPQITKSPGLLESRVWHMSQPSASSPSLETAIAGLLVPFSAHCCSEEDVCPGLDVTSAACARS
jgi:hypothetical protein